MGCSDVFAHYIPARLFVCVLIYEHILYFIGVLGLIDKIIIHQIVLDAASL